MSLVPSLVLSLLIALGVPIALILGSTATSAQSFNCRYAKTPDEVLICQIPKLGEMDSKMANLYFGYRSLTHGRARQRLESDQSAWLQHRSSCGRNPSCIARAYRDRVTYLYEHSTPTVCDGPILKQPTGCDPGGASEITDNDVSALSNEHASVPKPEPVDPLIVGYDEEGKIDATLEGCIRYVKEMTLWDKAAIEQGAREVCAARQRHVEAYEQLQRSYRNLMVKMATDRRLDREEATAQFRKFVRSCIDYKLQITTGGHNIGIDIISTEIASACLSQGAKLLDFDASHLYHPW
jgi:uncharacterized protein